MPALWIGACKNKNKNKNKKEEEKVGNPPAA
jgi:hypothetical protein